MHTPARRSKLNSARAAPYGQVSFPVVCYPVWKRWLNASGIIALKNGDSPSRGNSMFACLHAPGNLPLLVECAGHFSPLVEETSPDTVVFDIRGLRLIYGSAEQV